MSENVMFTEEQFAKLIEAISAKQTPPRVEHKPEDETVTRGLAIGLLEKVNSFTLYQVMNTSDCPKFKSLVNAVTALAKEHI